MKSNLNDLRLKLASLAANSHIDLLSDVPQIQLALRKWFKDEYEEDEIEEALTNLIQENEPIVYPDDYYDGF